MREAKERDVCARPALNTRAAVVEKAEEMGIEPTFLCDSLGAFSFKAKDVDMHRLLGDLGWDKSDLMASYKKAGKASSHEFFGAVGEFIPNVDYGDSEYPTSWVDVQVSGTQARMARALRAYRPLPISYKPFARAA